MEKLKRLYKLYDNNRQYINIAVIILVIVAAVLFFGGKGESQTIEIPAGDDMESEMQTADSESETSQTQDSSSAREIFVDISGHVAKPGVYKVTEGSRLFEVIEQAGGLMKDADSEQFNQAEIVTDGSKIIIPGIGGDDDEEEHSDDYGSAVQNNGKVNINTADSIELQVLPGIGPSTAEKIIAYRKENGHFKKIEDLKNVSGIGEKTFQKLRFCLAV